jgi:hypothetical protein
LINNTVIATNNLLYEISGPDSSIFSTDDDEDDEEQDEEGGEEAGQAAPGQAEAGDDLSAYGQVAGKYIATLSFKAISWHTAKLYAR